MKVNIIIKDCDRKWILGRWAEELKKRLDYVHINGKDEDYDIIY